MKERGTTGAGRPQIIGVLRVHGHPKLVHSTHGRGTLETGNDILFGRSGVDTRSNDPRQYDDGWDEVIPSFDGTDFRQYERRVLLFVSNTRVAPERRAGELLERLEGHAFDLPEGIQDWETPQGVENSLDHLRMCFEPIDVFRQGGVVDDFVGDFERSVSKKKKKSGIMTRDSTFC